MGFNLILLIKVQTEDSLLLFLDTLQIKIHLLAAIKLFPVVQNLFKKICSV